MKKYITDFLAGVLVVVTILTMNFITLDLRIATFLPSFLIGLYSSLALRKRNRLIISIALLCIPISTAFIFGILPEIPNLWTAIPIFVLSSFIGFSISKKWVLGLGSIVIIAYSFILVPKLVEGDLSQFVNEASPELSLQILNSELQYDIPSQKNKVIVLDFYGTWCKPCITEIEELQQVRNLYKNNKDVEFALVCTEFSKDTPEKANVFIKKRGLNSFINLFDEKNRAHERFGFTGVPALIIIDKQGKVRFKHEGYNKSENLTKTLKEIIDELLIE